MRVDGRWLLCDDFVLRPVVKGEVRGSNGNWYRAEFLIDTGADRSVLAPHFLEAFQVSQTTLPADISGLGGGADSFEVASQIQFRAADGGVLAFRGNFALLAESEYLDVCVLGRDVTNLFSILIDWPNDAVAMLQAPHVCRIEEQSS